MEKRELLKLVVDSLGHDTAEDLKARIVPYNKRMLALVTVGNVTAFTRMPDDYNFIHVCDRFKLMAETFHDLTRQALGQQRSAA